MANEMLKKLGQPLLLGSGVVILTPIVAGLFSGIELLSWEIPAASITVGTAIAAGLVAFGLHFAISKWLN